MQQKIRIGLFTAVTLYSVSALAVAPWTIQTTDEWMEAMETSEGLSFSNGYAAPTNSVASYISRIHTFTNSHAAKSITVAQSPVWDNWKPISNLGPVNLLDAPVLLTMGPDNYWLFGRYGTNGLDSSFVAEEARHEGFDVPLKTTPFPNQFDAPGGLRPGLGGYHAWQSRDMKNWVHHGPVTEEVSRWVTTAEYIDGKTYIYYDYPNDQDPHLFIDEDLTDGLLGTNIGRVFKDPSNGSDCTFIRDLAGNFHVIYEDWSPINAKTHSWDSPLAGHAVSPDGIHDFSILPPAIDHRTIPTGKTATHLHPHWMQHPEWTTNIATYQVHEPEQNAYGDWAAICIGTQYYLFCDYHPAHKKIRLGRFTSSSLDEPFTFCGELGMGHPDPDIAFAEGRFYLITQMDTDYISSGPWVDHVEIRVGVDTNQDQQLDTWSDWQPVREQYDYMEGFSKQIQRIPASLDLSSLPAGYAFGFEVKTSTDSDAAVMPILDSITLTFE